MLSRIITRMNLDHTTVPLRHVFILCNYLIAHTETVDYIVGCMVDELGVSYTEGVETR
jgi:hypothetical protein